MVTRGGSLRARFGRLLGGGLLVLFALLLVVRVQERRANDAARAAVRVERDRQLARWVEIFDRPLQEFLLDVAPWSETRAFLAQPDPAWARAHLEAPLADRNLDAIWLVRADGHMAFARTREPSLAPPALPAARELADAARAAPRAQFFASDAAGVFWQYRLAAVPSDHGPAGWLVAARRWEASRLEQLGALADCDARIEPPLPAMSPPPAGAAPEWRTPLRDFSGRRVGDLVLQARAAPADEPRESLWLTLALYVAFGGLLLTALALALNRWVLRPLDCIGASLRERAPDKVAPIAGRGDEFAPIAALVVDSFAQRAALQHEVEERRRAEEALRASQKDLRHSVELRSRLARDLHDHVIQSIYAAGLGLESVRAQMSVDPFGAEGRIRHCMDNLNETIRQVRSYINDLEPDPTSERQHFTDAVRALAATMHQLWPVEFVLNLDEPAATRMTNVVEVHALQIVRESLSNALRHGRATRVEIRLANVGGGPELSVRDNGTGFDPVQRMGTGRGLVNLTVRAREMGATLRIDSQEGAGACVTLRLAPPPEGAAS